MKQTLIIVAIVVAIVVGAVLLGKKDDTITSTQGSNNWYGQENGVVTLTEYGDFQCPACGQFFPIVAQVKELFKEQIRFEFKHFPLVQIHPNATAAHRAAQASANQNKFWEMHDMLYQRQTSWTNSTNPTAVFEGYARELGLDMNAYNTDTAASQTLGIINFDIDSGKSQNVSGTPTFFIDGVKVEDTASIASVESFSQVIQAAIEAKKSNQ